MIWALVYEIIAAQSHKQTNKKRNGIEKIRDFALVSYKLVAIETFAIDEKFEETTLWINCMSDLINQFVKTCEIQIDSQKILWKYSNFLW